jgi:hypothetical protein
MYCTSTSVQVTLFRVAMYNTKFKHRDFKVYTGRVDKIPPFPSFVAIENEGSLMIIFTLHPLYYQESDPPLPLDMRQGGKNSYCTKKISTGYKLRNCRLILA